MKQVLLIAVLSCSVPFVASARSARSVTKPQPGKAFNNSVSGKKDTLNLREVCGAQCAEQASLIEGPKTREVLKGVGKDSLGQKERQALSNVLKKIPGVYAAAKLASPTVADGFTAGILNATKQSKNWDVASKRNVMQFMNAIKEQGVEGAVKVMFPGTNPTKKMEQIAERCRA